MLALQGKRLEASSSILAVSAQVAIQLDSVVIHVRMISTKEINFE
jgi:hypothetical protein